MLHLLLLICSIASKQLFIAVGDFSALKEQFFLKPDNSGSITPRHPGKSQSPSPGEVLQIKFPFPQAQKIVKCAWGGGGVEVSI